MISVLSVGQQVTEWSQGVRWISIGCEFVIDACTCNEYHLYTTRQQEMAKQMRAQALARACGGGHQGAPLPLCNYAYQPVASSKKRGSAPYEPPPQRRQHQSQEPLPLCNYAYNPSSRGRKGGSALASSALASSSSASSSRAVGYQSGATKMADIADKFESLDMLSQIQTLAKRGIDVATHGVVATAGTSGRGGSGATDVAAAAMAGGM